MQSTYYCPTCKAPVAYGQDFCKNCGAALTWTSQQELYYCPYCSSVVTYGRATCRICGTTLTWTELQAPAAQSYDSHETQNTQQQAYFRQTRPDSVQGAPAQGRRKSRQAARKKASLNPQKTIPLVPGLIFASVVAVAALIVAFNWNSITSSMQPNGLSGENPVPSTGELAIMSFTASPPTIAPGQQSTLQWNTSGAASLYLDHGKGKVATVGSSVVSPSENTTYTLVATNSTGSISRSTTVKIVTPGLPVISSFTASPSSIDPGQTTSLQWNATGASYITIDHAVGTVPASGSSAVSTSEDTTYTLTAGGPAGSVTASTTVTIARNLPVVSVFTANPPAINNGQASSLQWNVAGATSVSIDPNIGTVSSSGYSSQSPSENTTYTLTATNISGSVTATATIAVSQSKPPVIETFAATPAAMTAGQSSTLEWNVTGATSVTLDQGIGTVPASGNFSLSPLETTTYVLSASSGGSPVTATATISIVTAGTPTIISFNAVPGVITAGQYTDLSWNIAGADSATIDPEIGPVGLSGTLQVSPATHTTYTLTAIGEEGTATATVTVSVAQPNALAIVSFTSNPGTIHIGEESTLQWNVSGANSVTIDPDIGDVSLQGTHTVTPVNTTTYTLTAFGTSDTLTESATVTVNSSP